MMIKEFSEESVEKAKAAHTLGFDVISKYGISVCGGKKEIPCVVMKNIHTTCELDSTFFPELDIGDNVSVLYIIHFKDCNELYKKIKNCQYTNERKEEDGVDEDAKN